MSYFRYTEPNVTLPAIPHKLTVVANTIEEAIDIFKDPNIHWHLMDGFVVDKDTVDLNTVEQVEL